MDRSLSPIGRFITIEWVETTGSTNADLRDRALAGDLRPAVLIAEVQSAGRGRRDRRWTMEPGGGLLMSVFVPWTEIGSAHLVPTALGLATCDAVEAVGCQVFLKWPNDLVSGDDLKLGGMLSEIVDIDGTFRGVVCGLGLNVSWSPQLADGGLDSTSLRELGAEAPVDRGVLANDLIARLDKSLTELGEPGGRGARKLSDRYRIRCSTLGRTVGVELAGETIEGTAVDVSSDGHLVVEVDGVKRSVVAGDVVHVR